MKKHCTLHTIPQMNFGKIRKRMILFVHKMEILLRKSWKSIWKIVVLYFWKLEASYSFTFCKSTYQIWAYLKNAKKVIRFTNSTSDHFNAVSCHDAPYHAVSCCTVPPSSLMSRVGSVKHSRWLFFKTLWRKKLATNKSIVASWHVTITSI